MKEPDVTFDPDMPTIVAKFTFPDGEIVERTWTISDPPPQRTKGPPTFLDNPLRAWDHPQDPITLSGDVKAGHEDEARAWLK